MASIYSPTISTSLPSGFTSVSPRQFQRQSQQSQRPPSPAFHAQPSSCNIEETHGTPRPRNPMDTPPSQLAQNAIDDSPSATAVHPPLQESSTKDAQCFGAAQLNTSHDCWKRWYLIENDASIGYAPEWEHPSTYEGLLAAARQGLAAGKIWIDGSHARTVDGRPFLMSGFCFDRHYFITAAHYLVGASPEDLAESVTNMQNRNVEGIAISVSQTSEQMLKYREDPSLRYAYLVREDRERDVAVFRIRDGEAQWEHAILPNQLVPAAQHIWSYTFSVGYASHCRDEDQQEMYEMFWQGMRTILQAHPDPSLRKKFQDVVAKTGIPDFQQIFCPNRRAIAFGYILNTKAPPENLTQVHGGWQHHSIPGWFGLSGSMIGVLGPELEVEIIGLFKGAEPDELHNRFIAFTPQIIDWIHSVIGYEH